MKRKTLFIKSIGDVEILQHPRAKVLRISVRIDSSVLITVPQRVSLAQAQRFAEEKASWIIASKQRMVQKTANRRAAFTENGYRTRNHKLTYKINKENKIKVKLTATEIVVYHPELTHISHPEVQQMARIGIEKALKKEAILYLPQQLKRLAEMHNFTYNTIKLNKAKTRWGSCTSQNNINLTCYLMLLPNYLIDFVLLHELCHTIEKNHGPKFHALMDKVCFNAKMFNHELKKYSIKGII